jgi:hypothetical protein
MLFAFFESKGLIYMHVAPRGATINANCTLMVLGKFTKNFTMKRPDMLEVDWFFLLGQHYRTGLPPEQCQSHYVEVCAAEI